ncbi:MOSC domain-containing protein [Oceaniglobus indicus]|uniref:MOSC domain-containing protein n=1 Tax=Oceaniglobus indicus TaxID=2047749 RepID=UPI000C185B58|nr:MOSC N-terminal beta barrel domain-containing protein [Oceaniglobus indicus]
MRIRHLFRYPIKGLGAETLEQADLIAGRTIAGDRAFAVTHGASAYDPDAPAWQRRGNFQVVANSPALAMVTLTRQDGRLRLEHPDADPLTFDPDEASQYDTLADWVADLPGARPGPCSVARLADRALTDMAQPYVSIHNRASLSELSDRFGRAMAMHRFRANVWIDGADPWDEEDWIGREITLGTARLKVCEPVGRCAAPSADPDNGERDSDIIGALRDLRGTKNFGVYAEVIADGTIAPGDTARLEG